MNYPIGQHFIVGFEGTRVTPTLKKLIQKYRVGGIVLFARNIVSPRQVRELTKKLQALAPKPLLIAVDQEGGLVARFREPFTKIPPMAVVGRYFRKTRDFRTVQEVGKILGRELKAVGVNWDFAPVVDVHSNPKNPVIGQRAFGPDPKLVSRCAEGVIAGLHSQGVLSCVKHFPGHGATSSDSHLTLPVLKDPGRLIWKRDLWPYRRLIPKGEVAALMTAHVLYPELDEKNCATLSRPILTDLLRKKLRFKGVVVSDDLRMKAISAEEGIPEATVDFFAAGGDLALICREPDIQIKAMEKVAHVVQKSPALRAHFSASCLRLRQIKKDFLRWNSLPPLSVIGCVEHQKIIKKLA